MIFKKKDSHSNRVECNHIFNDYIRMADPKRQCITMYLRCSLCNETISLDVTSDMLANLFSDIALNHVNPIYVKALSNDKDIDFPNSHPVIEPNQDDHWRL